jgi:hypothetical protein
MTTENIHPPNWFLHICVVLLFAIRFCVRALIHIANHKNTTDLSSHTTCNGCIILAYHLCRDQDPIDIHVISSSGEIKCLTGDPFVNECGLISQELESASTGSSGIWKYQRLWRPMGPPQRCSTLPNDNIDAQQKPGVTT